jgi:hypothetical protein
VRNCTILESGIAATALGMPMLRWRFPLSIARLRLMKRWLILKPPLPSVSISVNLWLNFSVRVSPQFLPGNHHKTPVIQLIPAYSRLSEMLAKAAISILQTRKPGHCDG